MASNHHIEGTSGSGYIFPKPINHLNIYVGSSVVFTISFDNGDNFITVPPGLFSMPVGITTKITVTSTGAYSIVGVQA